MRGSMIAIAAVCGALWAPGSVAWRHAEAQRSMKPQAPVEVELTALPREKKDPEGQRRLRVIVTPRIDAPA